MKKHPKAGENSGGFFSRKKGILQKIGERRGEMGEKWQNCELLHRGIFHKILLFSTRIYVLPKKSPQKPHFMRAKNAKGCATSFLHSEIETKPDCQLLISFFQVAQPLFSIWRLKLYTEFISGEKAYMLRNLFSPLGD